MNKLFAMSALVLGFGFMPGGADSVPPDTRVFIFGSGKDTGSETFTRTATSLTGDLSFSTMKVHYEAKLSPEGTIPRLDVRTTTSGDKGQATRLTSVVVGRDSTEIVERQGTKTESMRLPTQPGLLPIINLSVGLSEVLVARARLQKSTTAMVPVYIAADIDSLPKSSLRSRAGTGPIVVTFLHADTVMIGLSQPKYEKDKVRLTTDANGRIRSVASGADAKDHFEARLKSMARPPRR